MGALVSKIFGVLAGAVESFYERKLPQFAAALSYRVLFSLVPLAIVVVSVAGLVLQDDSRREDVVEWVTDHIPFESASVDRAIDAVATPASAAGLLSLVLVAWTATGMMTSLRHGLDAAMGTRTRPMVRGKLVDLILVGGAGALVLLAVTAGILVRLLRDRIDVGGSAVGEAARFGLSGAVLLVVVVLVLRFVPAHTLRFREVLAGSILSTILLIAISFALEVFVTLTTRWSTLYGSLASLMAFLYSVYLYAFAFLLGGAFAAGWSAPPGEPTPLRQQIRDGILGLFRHPEPPEPPQPPPA